MLTAFMATMYVVLGLIVLLALILGYVIYRGVQSDKRFDAERKLRRQRSYPATLSTYE